MQFIHHTINAFIRKIGSLFSWACLLLVILVIINVVFRYVFSKSWIWMVELERYLFTIIIMIGGAYAYLKDKHVRVDVWYENYTPLKKQWTNHIGILFLLLPWAILSFWFCWDYAARSFSVGEASGQPGGLPALYILKSILALGFLLIVLQGISFLLSKGSKSKE